MCLYPTSAMSIQKIRIVTAWTYAVNEHSRTSPFRACFLIYKISLYILRSSTPFLSNGGTILLCFAILFKVHDDVFQYPCLAKCLDSIVDE